MAPAKTNHRTKAEIAIDKAIGTHLRRLRGSRGLSQHALADRVGLSYQQIQKYENAKDRIASSRLVTLARAIDVEPAEFFEDLPA